jgi:hypothetical protein
MTPGSPGGDPDPDDGGSLGDGVDEVLMRWLAKLTKIAVFVAVPPLFLHRDRPIAGLWKWRKIYLMFLVGTALVFLKPLISGDIELLAVFPFFHLIAAALVGKVLVVTMAPTFAPSVSVPSVSAVPLRAEAVAVAAFGVAVFVVLRRGSIPSLDGSLGRSFSAPDDEYVVPMTEVWKSGGKHD